MRSILLAVCIVLSPMGVVAQTATYYADSFEGRRMANGRRFSQSAMVAASNNYKLGTRVRVTNRNNKKSVVVTVSDRCGRCSIDLSKAAFRRIGALQKGRIPVSISVVRNM